MQRALSLVSLLVLGSAWTLQGAHILRETLTLTQEDFDLDRFMGKWYEVAVASTCPHYMQRKRGNPVIVALTLQHDVSDGNFTMMATTFRNGSCQQTSRNYGLTNTPGRFFYHVAKFGADVDSYVVHTNYDEYAMILQLSTEKQSGNTTTIVKLYGDCVKTAFLLKHKLHEEQKPFLRLTVFPGGCVPGEPVTNHATPQRGLPQVHI
uniref:Lipocalin/cytosolic fatty-acid binding domain-containing protein n=1 Tax=Lates calcarifer TaxID=8187 RepID=A0A4W6CCZ6_LATCA